MAVQVQKDDGVKAAFMLVMVTLMMTGVGMITNAVNEPIDYTMLLMGSLIALAGVAVYMAKSIVYTPRKPVAEKVEEKSEEKEEDKETDEEIKKDDK